MRLMDRLIDSQSSAMDDNDPIEEWVQTLVAERPQWAREEGRRRDEEAMAKARALLEATDTIERLSEEELIRVIGVVFPEEMRDALLRAAAKASPENRARILLPPVKCLGTRLSVAALMPAAQPARP
jgi:hypothetical protein